MANIKPQVDNDPRPAGVAGGDALIGGRWPKRVALVGGALLVVALAVALVDYAVTTSRIPEYSPSTTGGDPEVVEGTRLREGFNDRAWIYAIAIVAIVGVAASVALRRLPAERRREIFTDLGVAGVVSGIAAVTILSSEPGLFGDIGGPMVWLPCGCFLAAAAAGSIFTRRPAPATGVSVEGGSGEPGHADSPSAGKGRFRGIHPVAATAVSLAALTLLLVVLGLSERECGEEAPGWTENTLFAAAITGLAAGGLGVVSLFLRRWVAALVSIPAAALGFFGILAAACLS